MVKIEVFRTLRENATLDFAHFAYLDRSHQYLQLLYWHHCRQKSSRAFRGHFMSTILAFSKKNNFKSTFFDFESSDRSDTAYYASIKWVEAFAKDRRSKNIFKEIKKIIIGNFFSPNRVFLTSKPLFSILSHRIGLISHIIIAKTV